MKKMCEEFLSGHLESRWSYSLDKLVYHLPRQTLGKPTDEMIIWQIDRRPLHSLLLTISGDHSDQKYSSGAKLFRTSLRSTYSNEYNNFDGDKLYITSKRN